MSLFKQFSVDQEKVTNGIPVTFGANDDGTIPTFYVSFQHSSNKEYKKVGEAEFRPHRRQIELKTLDENTADSILVRIFVKSVLKGWRNVQREDGSEIVYSEAEAIELLTALPLLREELERASTDAAGFRISNREADAKN